MKYRFTKRKLLNGKVHKGYWIEVDGEKLGYVTGENPGHEKGLGNGRGYDSTGSWRVFTLDGREVKINSIYTSVFGTRNDAAEALMGENR